MVHLVVSLRAVAVYDTAEIILNTHWEKLISIWINLATVKKESPHQIQIGLCWWCGCMGVGPGKRDHLSQSN